MKSPENRGSNGHKRGHSTVTVDELTNDRDVIKPEFKQLLRKEKRTTAAWRIPRSLRPIGWTPRF